MKSFAIHVPQYEGPLDLLLSIVRRNELSITALPLAPIAAQYLTYIREAETLDVNLGMEWIDMAARLIHWKSSSLLPSNPVIPDPGAVLAQELSDELRTLSEAQLVQATGSLVDRNEQRERIWTKAPSDIINEHPQEEGEPFASLWTVRGKARAMREMFQNRRQVQATAFVMDLGSTSVEEMKIAALLELEAVERGVWFSAAFWFVKATTLERRLCLFLALLDLAGNGIVRIDDDTVAYSVRLCRP